MTIEEYKKRVESALRKRYPKITEERMAELLTLSDDEWEQYKQDFTPEELPGAWEAGA